MLANLERLGFHPEDVEFIKPSDPPAKEFLSITKSPTTKIARAMVKAAHQQQVERVQRQAARKLAKYFQKSIKQITTRLFADTWEPNPEKAKSQAARLIKGAYDKDAQGDLLVDSASQPVADAFVDGAAAEMRLNAAARRRKAFDPSQPRDESGRWSGGGQGDFTNEQADALRSYKSAGATSINRYLRTGESSSPEADKETVKHIDAAMEKSSLGEDMTLYRGVGFLAWEEGDFPADPQVGDEFVEKGFVSTSTDKSVAFRFADGADDLIVKINAPSDMRGISLDGILENQEPEHEWLLDRNTRYSVAKIGSINTPSGKRKLLTLNVTSQIESAKGIKVTTATQAAERAEEEIDFPTEMPEWLEEAALDFISHTFEEDYWLRIPETTRDDIEYTLEQGIEDGLSIREIARRIQEDHGGAYSKSRATMVARTEMTGAMNAGHTEGIRQAYEGTGVEPAKEWLSVMGTTTRDTHADADGQQRPVDEDFDIGGHPAAFPGDARLPAGERCNCFPAGVLVIANGISAGYRARYKGTLYEIATAGGRSLTVTENHPILAERGWVRASELQVGDKLWAALEQVEPEGGGEHVDYEPTAIEDVFESLRQRVVSTGPATVTKLAKARAADFYGDGQFINGEIDIVRTDSYLRPDGKPAADKVRSDYYLPGADARLPDHAGDGPPAFPLHRLDSTSPRLPGMPKESIGGGGAVAVVSPPRSLAIGIAPNLDTSFLQSAGKPRPGDVESHSYPMQWFSGTVRLDHVVQVSAFEACDHVYDLQSADGIILARNNLSGNGFLIASNCQCTILSAFVGEGLSDDEEGTRAFDPSQPRDDHGRWAADDGGTSIQGGAEPAEGKPDGDDAFNASAVAVEVAVGKLNSLPSAEEGYNHFNNEQGDEIRMVEFGFHPSPDGLRIYGLPPQEKIDKFKTSMVLDPITDDLRYAQSSVIRSAVERKIRGNDPQAGKYGANDLPFIVKEDGVYYLQNGHHRSAADILLTGKLHAEVIEVVSRGKPNRDWRTGKPKYGKVRDQE